MFSKKKLVVVMSAIISASSAYAATKSEPTPAVVGFKPVFEQAAKDAVSGELKIGQSLTVNPEKLGFSDRDGDVLDADNSIFEWFSDDGIIFGTGASLVVPPTAGNRIISLRATPTTKTGDPLTGDALVIADVSKYGAIGGVVDPSDTASPLVQKVVMTAKLAPGNNASATYEFLDQGGDTVDSSTFAWGILGQTKANVTNSTIVTSGQVPEFTITKDMAGQVLELALQAKNGKDIIGNTMIIDSTGKAATENGGSTEGSGGTKNITGGVNGKVEYAAVDPTSVTIAFTSSATVVDNGVEGVRPVAATDTLKVTLVPGEGGSTNLEDYTYQWFAGDKLIPSANQAELVPAANTQGLAISVAVEHKPKG